MGDERQGFTQNTNETSTDDVEAHALSGLNTNETAADDEVDAHGVSLNANETADDDE
jgi:hypothetical protein